MQDDDSVMYGFYCVAFIEYLIAGKILLVYTNLFSPNDYQKNDNIIYKFFYINVVEKIVALKESLDFRLKNRWNKKLSFRWNKA